MFVESTPVKFAKGEKSDIELNIPWFPALCNRFQTIIFAIALAVTADFVYLRSQSIEVMVDMVQRGKEVQSRLCWSVQILLQ